MSLTHSPKIVTDGLVMYYDMPNGKSFVGAPVTNTLDNPSINGYPTYGNGWGTYNTNQYNGAQYFSIGTIASVSGNIVTTTAAHPLFSYSVVTPQSSGGGLTAGTYYTIKKLSSTTFTLHAYNGSQDGSQGYINPATGTHKVFDDFANDVRVAVSESGFPTMWWGPPHTPNSCLVKEIIPSGFTGILGRAATDCIRLHWIQPDGVVDGMAYGPNGAVVAGQVYTVSFWTRSVTPSAVGQSLSYQIYNHGVVAAAGYSFGAVLGPVGVWTKQSMTFTPVNPNCISYFFPSTGNMKVDVANIQFEVGSVANNFMAGTRYANNNLESTPNYPTWNQSAASASGGTLTFTSGSYTNKGTWDLYKTYSGLSTGTNYTWSALVKKGTATNFIVTMNNTQAWDTGPADVFSEFSSTEWKRVSITGTTTSGSFNIHLGSSYNTGFRDIVQTGGTILIQDVRLQLTSSQTSIKDLTDQNTIAATSLTYASDGTFSFNNNYADIVNSTLISGNNPYTIDAWYNSVSGTGAIFGNYGSGYTTNTIWVFAGGLYFNGSYYITSYSSRITGKHNICVTRDSAGAINVYFDGILDSSFSNTTAVSTSQNYRIGADVNGAGEPFNGSIYSVKVYSRALSAAEVSQNFNALRGKYGI